jgi:hypothetical protein
MINIPSLEGGGYQLEAETVFLIKQPTADSSLGLHICVCSFLNDRLCGLVVKSSWLQIRRPGFDFRHYQIFRHKQKGKQVVGLERGPLSLVSTTEELLDRKVAVPV